MLAVRSFRRILLLVLVLRVATQHATIGLPYAVQLTTAEDADADDYAPSLYEDLNTLQRLRQAQQDVKKLETTGSENDDFSKTAKFLKALDDGDGDGDGTGEQDRYNFVANAPQLQDAKGKLWRTWPTGQDISGNGLGSERAMVVKVKSDGGNVGANATTPTNVDSSLRYEFGVNYDGAGPADAHAVALAALAASELQPSLWQVVTDYYNKLQSQRRLTKQLLTPSAPPYSLANRAHIFAGLRSKRQQLATDTEMARNNGHDSLFQYPSYDNAPWLDETPSSAQEESHTPAHHYKRQRLRDLKGSTTKFVPSISSGAMTSLGDFFRDLSHNVHFTEQFQMGNAEEQLLDGEHPLRMLSGDVPAKDRTHPSHIVHALRTYRPSQKVRSLVAMSPYGYKSAKFIDPNYLWMGLGK